MKRLFFCSVLVWFLGVGIVNAGVSIDGNNDELSYGHWLPKKAYIAFNQQNGTISSYRVVFQADGGELFNHWKLKNSNNYEIPFPFVLESTLIIDDKNEVERTNTWGFGRLDGNNSNIPSAYLDSTFSDLSDDKYGIGILDSNQLQGDVIYDHWVGLEPGSVSPKDCRTLAVKLRFRLNIDLSEAKKFGYTEDEIESDFELGDGWKGLIGTDFGYRNVDISQDYSAQDIGDYFSFAIEKRVGDNHLTYSDYFVLSGMEGQWCKERNRNAYQVNSIEECFGLNGGGGNNSGSGTDEDPQIFTEGNHTHVLAPSYRCSKETNGPILCWESGGDTNCWDAWKWYQFNGEVGEVAEHRTDSAWITTRDRSMCAEVYNSNGNSGGGNSGGSGSGYTDDSGTSNPWTGYAHYVGLKYMKIGKKSSGHWSGSKTWTEGEIPSKRDFRIKLKQKGGVWPDGDTCAEVWFSHNKHFTDEDLFLKRKCKDLSDETEDERSIYVKDVHLPSMEVGKNYYFFTVVTYPGGANPSSEGDHDEYVKVGIADNPADDNSSNNQTSWDNLPEATKAAIMSIIFD